MNLTLLSRLPSFQIHGTSTLSVVIVWAAEAEEKAKEKKKEKEREKSKEEEFKRSGESYYQLLIYIDGGAIMGIVVPCHEIAPVFDQILCRLPAFCYIASPFPSPL